MLHIPVLHTIAIQVCVFAEIITATLDFFEYKSSKIAEIMVTLDFFKYKSSKFAEIMATSDFFYAK